MDKFTIIDVGQREKGCTEMSGQQWRSAVVGFSAVEVDGAAKAVFVLATEGLSAADSRTHQKC